MKKKLFILLSGIVLSLTLAAGVTYAFFTEGIHKDASFEFGSLSAAATITQDARTTFSKAGDVSAITLTVGAGTGSAPFTYGFTVRAKTLDAELASSVLVRFDGEFLGTAAQVFDGEYEISPDRYLSAGSATHTLELEYHLGAGAFRTGKKLDLTVSCTAATADAGKVAFVRTAEEFASLTADAEAGRLADGFRIVLTEDIAAPAAKSAVPLTLDLNGHALRAALTLAGAGENRILSGGAGSLDSLTLDNAAGWVRIEGVASVGAAAIVNADKAAQTAVMAEYAARALRAGLSALTTDVLGAYRALAGDGKIAVSGEGYADGAITPTQSVDARTEALNIGGEQILYTVYGTGALGDAGGNLAELDALMNVQLQTDDGTARTVAYDLLLPVRLKSGARVAWRSSNPNVVTAAGKYIPSNSDSTLTLTAELRYNGRRSVRQYAVKIKNSRDKAALLREILDAYGDVTFAEPEEKFYLPTPLANQSAQRADPGYADLSAAELAKMNAVDALIAESGIQDFAYNDEDKLIADGHLVWDGGVDSLKLITATGVHRTNLTVTATFADGSVEDSLAVYIDVASVAEAMKYLNAMIEDGGDIAANVRNDRFHNIDAYGNDRSDETPSDADGVYAFHGDATARTFGKDTALGKTVREGSFVLPERYTNLSGGATFAGGAGEKVFYYFYYYLDGSSTYAENGAPAGSQTLAADELPLALGADLGAPTVELAAVPDFNNFFLVDPARLPSAGTTLNLQVALYRANGSAGYTLEGTIQNVSLTIPGAIHNDAEGFEDAEVFTRVAEMLADDASIEYRTCPLIAEADTIPASVCEDAEMFVIDTSSDAVPLQITGSMAGMSAFVNLKTLRLIGTEARPLFAAAAGEDPVIAAMNGALANLTKLTSLTMNHCGVTRIDPVGSMPQLAELDVAHNADLVDISAVVALGALTRMNVAYCGFDFIGALRFDSPYAEVSVFEAICSANPSATVEITYSYRASAGATETTAVYAAKFANITENQQKAKAYLNKFDFSSQSVYNKMYLPTVIMGAADARLAYRVISSQSATITTGSGNYAQAVPNADETLWTAAKLTQNANFALVSPGAGKTVVLQVIVIVTDPSGNDLSGAYYCANFAVTFSA